MGFGADLFGDGEGALEERFEVSGDGAYFAGDGVGLFDLAEDLGLADDHAVERAGDAEEVADGFALADTRRGVAGCRWRRTAKYSWRKRRRSGLVSAGAGFGCRPGG